MQVEYELTMHDLEQFHIYYFRHSPTLRRQTFFNSSALFFVLMVCGVMFGMIGNDIVFFLICAVAAVVIFFVTPSLLEWNYKRVVRKLLLENTRGKGMATMKDCMLSLTPTGITSKSVAGEGKFLWSSIEKIVVVKDYMYLFLAPANAFIVPRRAFADQQAWDAFTATAQQYHKQGQTEAPPQTQATEAVPTAQNTSDTPAP